MGKLLKSAEQLKDSSVSHQKKRRVHSVFLGSDGLRAGWSIILFVAIFTLIGFSLGRLLRYFFGHPPQSTTITLMAILPGECVELVALIAATSVMSMIERRSVLSFGLQGCAKMTRFAAGSLCGFGAISVLVFILVKLHVLAIEASAANGADKWTHALGWGGVFLIVGMFEELGGRGYLQYTLIRGIGFWWGALMLCALFGGAHWGNPGETSLGIFQAGCFAAVLSLSLWYTGSLFWAIGFHAAWDWGESYFYGAIDSGVSVNIHLFTVHAIGNVLLSGGSTGPEGSILMLPLLGMITLLMWSWWGLRIISPFSDSAWKPARQ